MNAVMVRIVHAQPRPGKVVPDEPGADPRQRGLRVPADVDAVVFGIFLAGPGRIELRNPELRLA